MAPQLESVPLMNGMNIRDIKRKELDLLENGAVGSIKCPDGLAASLIFLKVYMSTCLVGALYLSATEDSGSLPYYVLSALMAFVGILSISYQSPAGVLIIGVYYFVSFLAGSTMAGCAAMTILQDSVCAIMDKSMPELGIAPFCYQNKPLFRAISIGTLLLGVLLEIFVLSQVARVYKLFKKNCVRASLGYPGTINITV